MLKQLHLTFNHLQASAVKQIAFELPKLVHMEKLFLSYNSLGEEGGDALAKSLTSLTKMTILHLKNCSLRGAGVKSIAKSLLHLTRMRRLAIENNGMFTRGEGVYESLARALRQCHSLELLNVGHALDPDDVALLFDAIKCLESAEGRKIDSVCKVDNEQVQVLLMLLLCHAANSPSQRSTSCSNNTGQNPKAPAASVQLWRQCIPAKIRTPLALESKLESSC